ncbi:MAG: hypothetical protein ACJ8EN_14695, partial [Xanthobacteraceae bacterium]
ALARGRTWASALRRGEYVDTAEIASKCDLSEAYVRRILRLAFLRPISWNPSPKVGNPVA